MIPRILSATAWALVLTAMPATALTDTRTRTFNPEAASLKVSVPGDLMSPPIMRLGSDDRIDFNFDVLADDADDLCARLIHCNADWQPSALLESEYLEGFNFDEITDYGFSSNTFARYTNYDFSIPSEGLQPKAPGNYLLQVFPRENPDDIWLQARFMAVDPMVTVSGVASSHTDKGVNNGYQQLSLLLDPHEYKISNPYTDLKVYVVQNSSPDAVSLLQAPLAADGVRLKYAHSPQLIFPALNEFRRFETVRADYPGLHVDSVRFEGNRYHAYLAADADRSEHEYSYDLTQAGRYVVREYNASDSNLGADYVTVHFNLDFPELIGASVYVDGEFTHHLYTDANRMTYDRESHTYRLAMPLKQGSYNYRYTVLPNSVAQRIDARGDASYIEGNKSETRNEYLVLVYHRPPGTRADMLTGAAVIYSE